MNDMEPSEQNETPHSDPLQRRGTGMLAVAHSVGAALLGVQSKANKERDFQHGNPVHFFIGGIIGTILFLLAIWVLVKVVIRTA